MSAESDPPSPSSGVLVCFAVREEAAPFRKIAGHKAGVSILVTGIGRANSEKSARNFLKASSPRLVLTCGFAGGLDPSLKIGTVIFETRDESLREKLAAAGATPVKFHCANRIATTAEEKRELRQTTGADAVEMESEAIQTICRERGIPCATVRVISDEAGEDLPLDFNRLSRPDMSLDYGKLFWAIVCSPGKIGPLIKLGKQTQLAAEKLAAVLAQII